LKEIQGKSYQSLSLRVHLFQPRKNTASRSELQDIQTNEMRMNNAHALVTPTRFNNILLKLEAYKISVSIICQHSMSKLIIKSRSIPSTILGHFLCANVILVLERKEQSFEFNPQQNFPFNHVIE